MDIYRRYFKVTTGPLLEAVEKIEKINHAAHAEYLKILNEIGAEPGYYHRDMRLVSIVFKEEPDTKLYMKKDSGWYPKKNSKVGKDLACRLESVNTQPPSDALKAVGLYSFPPVLFSGGRAYSATLVVIPEKEPVAYVSVPWYDEDPEKIAQYKEYLKTGQGGSANMDLLLWEPTPGMVEVKGWEKDRHIDEWNERVRSEKE